MKTTEIYSFGGDFGGLMLDGHLKRDSARGEALNDHSLRYEFDITPQEIFKARIQRTYLLERKCVHPGDYDVEWLTTEDPEEPGARPITLVMFDGKLRTIEQWREELKKHQEGTCYCNGWHPAKGVESGDLCKEEDYLLPEGVKATSGR